MNQEKLGIKLNKRGNKRGMHPNSRKNLRNDANLDGRPKAEDCLLSCIKEELSKTSLNGKETNEQLIAAVLVQAGTRGSFKAIELMLAYLHAKPTASVDVTTKGEAIGSRRIEIPESIFRDALVILAKSNIPSN